MRTSHTQICKLRGSNPTCGKEVLSERVADFLLLPNVTSAPCFGVNFVHQGSQNFIIKFLHKYVNNYTHVKALFSALRLRRPYLGTLQKMLRHSSEQPLCGSFQAKFWQRCCSSELWPVHWLASLIKEPLSIAALSGWCPLPV